MFKKTLYDPPVVTASTILAEISFCESTNLDSANTGINDGYVNDYSSDLTFE